MNLLIQVFTTLALVLGIILGETLSTKAFGTFKKVWLYILEITLFVVVIVMIFNNITLTDYAEYYVLSIYFFTGLFTIIFVRGLMSGIGIFSEHVKKNILREKDELDYILGLKKSLERRGFLTKDILKIAKEIGFSQKNIDKVLVYFEIKPKKKKRPAKKPKKRKRKAY